MSKNLLSTSCKVSVEPIFQSHKGKNRKQTTVAAKTGSLALGCRWEKNTDKKQAKGPVREQPAFANEKEAQQRGL